MQSSHYVINISLYESAFDDLADRQQGGDYKANILHMFRSPHSATVKMVKI